MAMQEQLQILPLHGRRNPAVNFKLTLETFLHPGRMLENLVRRHTPLGSGRPGIATGVN